MFLSDVAEQNDLHVVRELMDCLDKVPAIKQEAMCSLLQVVGPGKGSSITVVLH